MVRRLRLLAPNGQAAMSELSLLSEVNRTSRLRPPTSEPVSDIHTVWIVKSKGSHSLRVALTVKKDSNSLGGTGGHEDPETVSAHIWLVIKLLEVPIGTASVDMP
jgi:hypothetical protein